MAGSREMIVGPENGPQKPFPIQLSGRIVKGFGRGSRELGIPTANLPIAGLEVGGHKEVVNGVYFGWAGLSLRGLTDASRAAEPPKGDNNDADGSNGTISQSESRSNDATAGDEGTVYRAVLSIGYNPYYKNEVRSVEVHIIHKFNGDLYNAMLNLSIEGFIRTEQDYESMQALIDDINTDTEVAKRSLERPAYLERAKDPFLLDFSWD